MGVGMGRIRILLVDDHPIAREQLRRMLEVGGDIEIVGEAASVREALAKADMLSPDIVLMNIKMPRVHGINGVSQLKERYRAKDVIVLTFYGRQYLAQAMGTDGASYILKDIGGEELINAIRATHLGHSPGAFQGRRSLSSQLTTAAENDRRDSCLSERELKLLRLVASGATNKEIAASLFFSEATVKRGMRGIFQKLNVKVRAEAVSEAYRRGLL